MLMSSQVLLTSRLLLFMRHPLLILAFLLLGVIWRYPDFQIARIPHIIFASTSHWTSSLFRLRLWLWFLLWLRLLLLLLATSTAHLLLCRFLSLTWAIDSAFGLSMMLPSRLLYQLVVMSQDCHFSLRTMVLTWNVTITVTRSRIPLEAQFHGPLVYLFDNLLDRLRTYPLSGAFGGWRHHGLKDQRQFALDQALFSLELAHPMLEILPVPYNSLALLFYQVAQFPINFRQIVVLPHKSLNLGVFFVPHLWNALIDSLILQFVHLLDWSLQLCNLLSCLFCSCLRCLQLFGQFDVF